MLAECTKCGSSKEIKLRITDGEAVPVCTECGTIQEGFSKIMINTMRSNKDIIFTGSSQEHIPFGFPCAKCGTRQELLYDKNANSAKCSVCGTEAKVSPYMLRSLELTGHVKRSAESTEEYEGSEDKKKKGAVRRTKE